VSDAPSVGDLEPGGGDLEPGGGASADPHAVRGAVTDGAVTDGASGGGGGRTWGTSHNVRRRTARLSRRWTRWPLRIAVLGWIAILLLIPVGSIIWRALSPGFSVVWAEITAPGAVHALVVTLEVAAVAVPANAIFGVGVALVLTRHRFPGAALLSAVVDMPLAVSPVVVGVAMLIVYGRDGWLGGLVTHGVMILFSIPGIIIASAFISLPYVARAVLPVLIEIGTEQEQAAATLGANPFTIFRRVTFPSIRYGVAYGVTLTTARVLGEFGAVSIVSGNIVGKTQTLTMYVDYELTQNFDPTGAYVGALVLCLISVAVLAILRLARSREVRRSWPSTSDQSRNDLETLQLSTASTSTSQPAP
jgi:sulfate/thiosulfate transport system permease protein